MAIQGKDNGGAGRRLRLGMVGGGEGAFIGAVHRIAARLDDHYTLVAGALSSTPEKALSSGAALGLDPKRTYTSFTDMAARERRRKDGIEAVAIVTPNHMHAPIAATFLGDVDKGDSQIAFELIQRCSLRESGFGSRADDGR